MFKNDPLRRQGYRVFIFSSLSCIIWIAYFAFVYFNPEPQHSNPYSSFILFFSPAYVVLVITVSVLGLIAQSRRWKRLDQLRLRALQGDQAMLAREQPEPDAYMLPLHTMIQLRGKSRVYLILFFLIAIIVVIIVVGAIAASPHLSATALLVLIFVLIFCVVVAAVISIITYKLARARTLYEIEVTERGITTKYQGFTTHINWNKARLFALSDGNKRVLPRTYELDSDDAVARWMWIPRNMYRAYSFEPAMSYEEYSQRMQALLDLIATRTLLPLYDLGETKLAVQI
jgi:hypothetical protein